MPTQYAVSAYIENIFSINAHNKDFGAYQDFGYYETKEDAEIAAENLRIKGAFTVDGISDVIVTETKSRSPTSRTNKPEKLDIPKFVMVAKGDKRLKRGDTNLPMVFVDNRQYGFGSLTMQFYTDGCKNLADIRNRQKEVEEEIQAKKKSSISFLIPEVI